MGFIHTHPTFSAFLSSIDLHMAAHIQNSIPEAIAIVVSEKDRTQPIFRITPEGMEILNKCDKQQLLHHTHSRDVTLYEECEVKYSKEDTIIKDMRKISDESTVMNLSIPSLPDLDIPREASTRIRDSFDRSGFNNLSFTKSVIPKGRPRKDKGGAPSFKPTKPSKSVGTITKKRKCADNANDETSRENEPAQKRPRGRPKGSKNVKKNDKNLKQKNQIIPLLREMNMRNVGLVTMIWMGMTWKQSVQNVSCLSIKIAFVEMDVLYVEMIEMFQEVSLASNQLI